MFHFKNKLYFFVAANLLCSLMPMSGQLDEDKALLYSRFDSLTGKENSGLYNGTLFVDYFRVVNDKHRFFQTSQLTNGDVTYGNQPYFAQGLKYDLYGDAILVNPKGASQALMIQLRNSKVEGFTLNDHNFIRVDSNSVTKFSTNLGFCEILTEEGSLLLLKKSRKVVEKKKNADYEYVEFKSKNSYIVALDGSCHTINSQRDWLSLVPNQKRDIKSFYRAYKALKKSDMDVFYIQLFKRFMAGKQPIEIIQ